MRSYVTEELVVGEYPTPITPGIQDMAMATVVNQSSHGAETTSRPAASTPKSTQKVTEASSVSVEADFDPHHPDLIVSYDVMNEEVLLAIPNGVGCLFV